MKRFWIVLMALLSLSACAPMPVKPRDDATMLAAQETREALIRGQGPWSFRGRVAVSQAGEGGSGGIEWRQEGEDFDIRLSAPVSRQGWQLTRRSGLVQLAGVSGGTRSGRDAEALLLEATGWRLPVAAMTDWVRGVRAAGPAELDFAGDGRPQTLRQQGWSVEFQQWDDGSPARPLKLQVRQGDASVRLVIDAWSTP